MTKTFRDLGVAEELCAALERTGITDAFPIQELSLPLALAGNDLIGQARTGTGKTLAFGLPLLQRIDPSTAQTQALVVVPTRELCVQVTNDLRIGTELGVRVVSVYGGVGYDEQIDALTTGAHVVIGTPGRLIDHLNRGNLDLSNVTELVLDEADEMLDMGFLPDVERLIEAATGTDRHTMLFSATMPTEIVRLGRRYMHQPTFTRAESQEVDTAPNVAQHFFQVHRMDKPRVLARILQAPGRKGVFVFVRTKHMADRLVTDLEELGTPAIAIHGDLRQTTRERNLDRFRSGKATVLVATEVAARGLDVTDVTHVINYDCPEDGKMYLHRIGRTARAGQEGVAITFAEHNETARLDVIRKTIGATDTDIVEVFSTSPSLTELFDLPAETPWEHFGRSNGSSANRSRPSNGGSSRSDHASNDRSSRRGRATRGGSARRGSANGDGRKAATDASATQEQSGQPAASEHAAPAADAPRAPARARTRNRTTATPEGGEVRTARARSDRDRKTRGDRDHEAREAQSGKPRSERDTASTKKSRSTARRSGSRPSGDRSRQPRTSDAPARNDATDVDTGQARITREVKVEHLP